MADEIEKLKKPTKKPVARYFSDTKQNDTEDVERIKVDSKKKAESFKGDVIKVQEKVKFFPQSKWNNRSGNQKGKFQKNKNKNLQLKVDPYARERHSSKFFHRIPLLIFN